MDLNSVYANLMQDRPICPTLQSCYQAGPEEKAAHLETQPARFLFAHLPRDIGAILRRGFLSGKPGNHVPGFEAVIDYFQKNSRNIPALTENPGTYTMLEEMYHFHPVQGP